MKRVKIINLLHFKLKILKYLLILITASAILLTASAILFINFFPEEKLKNIIVSNAEEILNCKITIGKVEYSLNGISLEKIIIYDGNSVNDPIIVEADDADLGISLIPLFQKKLNIDQIYFNNLKINIIYNDDENSNIEKIINQLVNNKKGGKDSFISTSISAVKLDKAEILLKNPPQNLKPLEGLYKINCIIELNENNNLNITDCKTVLPGKRGTLYPELKIINNKNNFQIMGDISLDKVSLLWVYKWGNNPPVPYHIVSGDVKNFRIKNNIIEGFVKASSSLINSKKIVFADGYCKVDIKKRTVFLSNVNGKIQTSTFNMKSLLFSTAGRLYNFNIHNIDAYITDIIPLLYFIIPIKLFGKIKGDLLYDNGLFNGSLNLQDFGYDSKEKIVSSINTHISIKNSIFKNENIKLRIFNNPCSVSIASVDNHLNKFFININSDRFLYKTDISDKLNNNPINIPADIIGKINIREFQYNDLKFSGIQINYSLSKNKLALNRFSSGFMNGNIQGKGSVILSEIPLRVTSHADFNNIKIQSIAALSGRFKNRLFGSADGKLDVELILSENIANEIKGKVVFSINKGKIINTGIQRGLGLFLSELRYKLKDLEFNKIYGNIDINKKNFYINSFVFNSEDIRLNMKGSMDNNLNASSVKINLEFTRHFIKDLAGPITLNINKYLKGKWYIIPFLVIGDITNSKNIKML